MGPSVGHLKILSSINDRIEGCQRDGITGELVIRIPFNQGKMGRVKVGREENLMSSKKLLDNLEIYRFSE